MRSILLLAMLTASLPASTAHGRLFWQTYGATIAAEGGCVWNINQDYFVPRRCDTGRYDLFSACKSVHSISAACKRLHPIYEGFCTPYGPCRYHWRDHVYKTHCGCTPLRHVYGPWRLDECRKHSLVLRHGPAGRAGGLCGAHEGLAPSDFAAPGLIHYEPKWLCNVEPFGGETLGSIAALASGAGGSVPTVSGVSLGAGGATSSGPSTLPTLGVTPAAVGGGLPGSIN